MIKKSAQTPKTLINLPVRASAVLRSPDCLVEWPREHGPALPRAVVERARPTVTHLYDINRVHFGYYDTSCYDS